MACSIAYSTYARWSIESHELQELPRFSDLDRIKIVLHHDEHASMGRNGEIKGRKEDGSTGLKVKAQLYRRTDSL